MLHLWKTVLSVNRKKLRRPEKILSTFLVFETSQLNVLQTFNIYFAYHNCNVESSKRFTEWVNSQRNEKIVMICLRYSAESCTFWKMAIDGTHGA